MDIPTIPNNFSLCFFSPLTLLPFFPFLSSSLQGLALSPTWTWTPSLKWSACPRLVNSWIVSAHPVVLSFKDPTTVQVKTCGFRECSDSPSPFLPALRKIFRQTLPVTVKFDPDCFFPLSHFSLNLIFSFLDVYSRAQLGVLSYCSFLHIKIREN